MRKNLGPKSLCYPMPVFIVATYNEDGTENAMTAAWGGITEENEITVCIDNIHKTAINLPQRNAFTVAMATAETVKACSYVGTVSGMDDADKFKKSGFTATRSALVDAPIINELPMVLECEMKSYDPAACRLIGRIVNVAVDEAYMKADGTIDIEKLQPLTYDPLTRSYITLGARVAR